MSIQNLRDKSDGVIAKVIVGLIIVVFALFGMGSITTFLTPVPKVATVDGQDVTQQEMEIAVERGRRMLLSQNTPAAEIDEDQLRQNVLQNLIDRKLLILAGESMGLQYSDQRLDAEIVSTPIFQVEGVFDPGQFQLVIGGAGYSALSYREEMRRDKSLQQLTTGIRSTAFLTEPQVLRTSSLAQQTRDVAFLRIDVDAMKDSMEVSDAEIVSFYDANPADFMTAETVDVDYVELKRADLIDAVEVSEADLLALFEETKDIYAQDERRRVAHILVEVNDQSSEAEAETRVNEVYQRIIGGEDFASLAKEYSSDTGSAENGGDLGFNAPGTFVEEFEVVAYDLGLNEMSAPVRTEFGFHLIKVLDIEAAKVPEYADVRDRVEATFRENRAEDAFVQRSARMSELAFETRDLFEISEELGLSIQSTGPSARDTADGLLATAVVANAAFSPDVLLEGNNSSLIEIDPNHHLVLRLRKYQPQEVKALAQVTDLIRERLALEKAVALAETQSKEIVAMLESGSGTRNVADQFNLVWSVVAKAQRNQPNLAADIGRYAFSLPRPRAGNKSVGYTLLADGDAAIVSVTNVQNKSAEDDLQNVASLARILASQQGASDFLDWREGLALNATVKRSN
ncbi:SurA N-terminal domain-containing protein [Pseudomonadales bacterium]|nr:SurA N-terminal domain-containing protein [Pseudomonadales bacterium]